MNLKLDIIGTGNVGTHLRKAFDLKADVNLVNSRTLESLREDCDVYLLCITDESIDKLACTLSDVIPSTSVLAHTSGATGLDILKQYHDKSGVFYPLQTFSKGVSLDYLIIPILIEGSDTATEEILKAMAGLISTKIEDADSHKRCLLHVGSVIASNFANHLWTLSKEYLTQNGVDFSLLIPLIKETTHKIEKIDPEDAQTGPAIRHDMQTIRNHKKELEGRTELMQIYDLFTNSIMKKNDKL